MPYLYKTAREYVDAVCNQIRRKKARDGIREELEGHISDQRSAYIGGGMSEAEATERAVEQMGDPVEVGAQLDRLHRPKPQPMMLILVFAVLLGGVIIRILIPQFSGGEDFIIKQTVTLVLGVAAMFTMYFVDYSVIWKYPKSFFGAVMIICVLVFSAEPRLSLSHVSASFSLLLPVAFTSVILAARGKGYFGIFGCFAVLSVQTLLCFMIPEITCGMVVSLCGVFLIGFAISKNHFNTNKFFSFLLLGAVIIFILFNLVNIFFTGRVSMRIQYAFNPQDDPSGYGWLSLTIREILENTKFIGHGTLPEALQGLSRYYDAHFSDEYMLFYLIYRWGWISFILIAALFGLFLGKAIHSCARLKSVAGKYVCTAVVLVLFFQFVLYCTSNFGFNLFSPLFLPLLSSNAATVINLGLIGLMLSAFRNDCTDKSSVRMRVRKSRFCIEDGKLIISLKR